jgi:hypothetical protein
MSLTSGEDWNMIILTLISTLAAVSVDTAASAERSALSKCLKESVASAKSGKVPVAGFEAYMRSRCAAPEADLQKAVIAIDVKNGISRADAAENAKLDSDDYFISTADRYGAEVAAAEPQQPQAAAPVPKQAEVQPAAAPQPQQ